MVLAFVLSVGVLSVDAYTHSMTLRQGMSGTQVVALQQALGITADGVFGPMTKAAVVNFQTVNGLVADGVVGPMTGAVLAGSVSTGGNYPAGCTSNMGYSTTTGASCAGSTTTLPAGCVAGAMYSSTTGAKCDGTTTPAESTELTGEGSVKDFSIGSAEESSVSEGESNMELVSFDVELENDGSLKLDRFDLYMGEDSTVTTESAKPWDYFSKAYLMADGEEVASMDVDSSSDWSEYDTGTLTTTRQEYRLRFTNLDYVLASDETTTISVAFDMVSNIDSADETADWEFGITTDSFRFADGTGFVFTDGEDLEDEFSLDTALEAALKISSANTDPDASVIVVDESTDTNGITLGVFEIEETEDVDVNISEMIVTLATSDTITDVVKTLYLYEGSTKVGEESVSALAVTFDNIDLDVNGDDTVVLTVKADLDDTNSDVRYQNGGTVNVASVNLTAYTDSFDNDEGDFTESGSYASETHALYAKGINASLVSVNKVRTFVGDAVGEDDQGEYTIVFGVTAFGDDMYVDLSTEDDNAADAAGQGVVFDITSSAGTPTVSSKLLTASGSETNDDATNEFWIEEDDTRTFTLTVILTADTTPADGSHEVVLESINWADATTAEAAGGVIDADFTNYYTFNLDDFKTGSLFLNAQ